MATRTIRSTDVQNNFGQVLSDITHNNTRYIVKRHGMAQIVMLSFDDFTSVLQDSQQREKALSLVREVRPQYGLGESLD